MRKIQKNRNRGNMSATVLIILAISIAFGFLFDFVVGKIEFSIYPKPDEYAESVSKYALEYGVPEDLVWAVIKTESDFDPSAVSVDGAIGLMQMLPKTFTWLSNDILRDYYETGMLYHPDTNIKYGTYYLSRLYKQFGDWDTAIAAYNGGEGYVTEWMGDDGKLDKDEIKFKETRNYVKKVSRATEKYKKLYASK